MAADKEEFNLDDLSDEEFSALTPEQLAKYEVAEEDDSGSDESNDESNDSDDEDQDEEEDNDEEEGDADDSDSDDDSSADAEDGDSSSSDDAGDDSGDDAGDDGDSGDDDKDKAKPGELTEVEYAAIGRRLMGDIKANGGTIKAKSADDLEQLIQMGANYHQKMKGLKPSMKTLKLLENHGLLDPKKLNYLIDLYQKKPEAITQLLKDSKIDPMDIDLKGEEEYAPENRTVNDKDLVLDDVLAGIKGNKNYNRTLTVIADDWDEASRATILADPTIIAKINGHMEAGVYDQVADAVTYQRTLGNLQGVSDFDAYQQMGDYMMTNDLFKSNGVKQSDAQGDQDTKPPKGKKETADQKSARLAKKKGASPSRRKKVPKKEEKDFNPLGMSDEDFAKHTNMNL
jgi:hypothetical protein